MVRHAYLIPRIIIAALIVLACWVGSDPLIRRVVVSKLESSTGAKVDIGHLRYSLSNHKLFLKDLELADPQWPMQNLLQAEMVYAELDPASLLSRQVIIETGQASEVVFGAPRTDSGALERFPTVAHEPLNWKPQPFVSAKEIGLTWLDSLPLNDSTDASTVKLELRKVAKGLPEYWQQQLQSERLNIAALGSAKSEFQQLQTRINATNPLRPIQTNSVSKINAIDQQRAKIQSRLLELQRLADSQRVALETSYNRDTEKIRQSAHATQFESGSVSTLLLTQMQEQHVAEIMNWFQWFRETMPSPQSDFAPKDLRGVDVKLPGVPTSPDFLIKSIELEGEGRFANQHLNFAGYAYNLTSQPELLDVPASFEIRAQGDQHLIVSCTLDRRTEKPIDSLSVTCPDLELPIQMLGEKNSMLVTMGPASHIQAEIQLHAEGDQISGELVFRHSNVSLHVDKLHEMAGGETTALQLNQGLASVDQFQTRVKLSGTMDNYQFEFTSDLGNQFAGAANRLLANKSQRLIDQKKQELTEYYTSQRNILEKQVAPELKRLSLQLNQASVEIASLQAAFTEPDGPQTSDRLKRWK
ncbi:MAG: hypothetical protein ACI814_000048 [Mariniblastus sp.]|jgi:uncharacterized protein (TIGR03545 family)